MRIFISLATPKIMSYEYKIFEETKIHTKLRKIDHGIKSKFINYLGFVSQS